MLERRHPSNRRPTLRVAWLTVLAIACSSSPPTPLYVQPAAATVPVGDVVATKLADVGYRPRDLTLDDTHVYWTISNDRNGSVWRVSKTGGEPQALVAELADPGPCIIVGSELWISSGIGLVAVPTTGGPMREVSRERHYGVFVRGPGGVYVANRVSGLSMIAPSGTAKKLTATSVVAIAGGDVVVFATQTTSDAGYGYKLWRLDGDVPVELANLDDMPFAIAHEKDTIFLASAGDLQQTMLHAVPLSGGSAKLFAQHEFGANGLSIDDGYIWWAFGDGIMRMSMVTKQPRLYAANPPGRHADPRRDHVVIDADAVYWLSTDMRRYQSATDAAVMRAPRR